MDKKKKMGRIPLPKGEKRIELRIYPKERHVEKCGGEKAAKSIAIMSIENFLN